MTKRPYTFDKLTALQGLAFVIALCFIAVAIAYVSGGTPYARVAAIGLTSLAVVLYLSVELLMMVFDLVSNRLAAKRLMWVSLYLCLSVALWMLDSEIVVAMLRPAAAIATVMVLVALFTREL